ncbi:MAG: peptide-methionine (S)-S-oxide reductase MsrA [bacterium]
MTKAIFAAGCFWGVQFYFDQISGVTNSTVGYIGGHTTDPTYEDVCYKSTGHAEAVQLEFDDTIVSYKTLVEQFLYMHDPTQIGGQGPDTGDQYRSAIFYFDNQQYEVAKQVITNSKSSFNKPIITELVEAKTFYIAEDYHQKFAERTGRGICHKPFKQM